jgi:HPt (histidine-containing phosphotransfer) domain-containing protein
MSHHEVFNFDEALVRVEQDLDILQTMADLFYEHGPKDLADIKAALAAGDSAAAARSAHRMKGAVLQFCAPAAVEATKALERAGKAGDLTTAREVYGQLEVELTRLLDALRKSLDRGLAA